MTCEDSAASGTNHDSQSRLVRTCQSVCVYVCMHVACVWSGRRLRISFDAGGWEGRRPYEGRPGHARIAGRFCTGPRRLAVHTARLIRGGRPRSFYLNLHEIIPSYVHQNYRMSTEITECPTSFSELPFVKFPCRQVPEAYHHSGYRAGGTLLRSVLQMAQPMEPAAARSAAARQLFLRLSPAAGKALLLMSFCALPLAIMSASGGDDDGIVMIGIIGLGVCGSFAFLLWRPAAHGPRWPGALA